MSISFQVASQESPLQERANTQEYLEAACRELYLKALKFQAGGELEQAEKFYLELIHHDLFKMSHSKLTPQSVKLKYLAFKNLAFVEIKYGRKFSAMLNLTRALEVEQDDVLVLCSLGQLALEQDQLALAREVLIRAVSLQPDHWFSIELLAETLYLLGDYETCLEFLSCHAFKMDFYWSRGHTILKLIRSDLLRLTGVGCSGELAREEYRCGGEGTEFGGSERGASDWSRERRGLEGMAVQFDGFLTRGVELYRHAMRILASSRLLGLLCSPQDWLPQSVPGFDSRSWLEAGGGGAGSEQLGKANEEEEKWKKRVLEKSKHLEVRGEWSFFLEPIVESLPKSCTFFRLMSTIFRIIEARSEGGGQKEADEWDIVYARPVEFKFEEDELEGVSAIFAMQCGSAVLEPVRSEESPLDSPKKSLSKGDAQESLPETPASSTKGEQLRVVTRHMNRLTETNARISRYGTLEQRFDGGGNANAESGWRKVPEWFGPNSSTSLRIFLVHIVSEGEKKIKDLIESYHRSGPEGELSGEEEMVLKSFRKSMRSENQQGDEGGERLWFGGAKKELQLTARECGSPALSEKRSSPSASAVSRLNAPGRVKRADGVADEQGDYLPLGQLADEGRLVRKFIQTHKCQGALRLLWSLVAHLCERYYQHPWPTEMGRLIERVMRYPCIIREEQRAAVELYLAECSLSRYFGSEAGSRDAMNECLEHLSRVRVPEFESDAEHFDPHARHIVLRYLWLRAYLCEREKNLDQAIELYQEVLAECEREFVSLERDGVPKEQVQQRLTIRLPHLKVPQVGVRSAVQEELGSQGESGDRVSEVVIDYATVSARVEGFAHALDYQRVARAYRKRQWGELLETVYPMLESEGEDAIMEAVGFLKNKQEKLVELVIGLLNYTFDQCMQMYEKVMCGRDLDRQERWRRYWRELEPEEDESVASARRGDGAGGGGLSPAGSKKKGARRKKEEGGEAHEEGVLEENEEEEVADGVTDDGEAEDGVKRCSDQEKPVDAHGGKKNKKKLKEEFLLQKHCNAPSSNSGIGLVRTQLDSIDYARVAGVPEVQCKSQSPGAESGLELLCDGTLQSKYQVVVSRAVRLCYHLLRLIVSIYHHKRDSSAQVAASRASMHSLSVSRAFFQIILVLSSCPVRAAMRMNPPQLLQLMVHQFLKRTACFLLSEHDFFHDKSLHGYPFMLMFHLVWLVPAEFSTSDIVQFLSLSHTRLADREACRSEAGQFLRTIIKLVHEIDWVHARIAQVCSEQGLCDERVREDEPGDASAETETEDSEMEEENEENEQESARKEREKVLYQAYCCLYQVELGYETLTKPHHLYKKHVLIMQNRPTPKMLNRAALQSEWIEQDRIKQLREIAAQTTDDDSLSKRTAAPSASVGGGGCYPAAPDCVGPSFKQVEALRLSRLHWTYATYTLTKEQAEIEEAFHLYCVNSEYLEEKCYLKNLNPRIFEVISKLFIIFGSGPPFFDLDANLQAFQSYHNHPLLSPPELNRFDLDAFKRSSSLFFEGLSLSACPDSPALRRYACVYENIFYLKAMYLIQENNKSEEDSLHLLETQLVIHPAHVRSWYQIGCYYHQEAFLAGIEKHLQGLCSARMEIVSEELKKSFWLSLIFYERALSCASVLQQCMYQRPALLLYRSAKYLNWSSAEKETMLARSQHYFSEAASLEPKSWLLLYMAARTQEEAWFLQHPYVKHVKWHQLARSSKKIERSEVQTESVRAILKAYWLALEKLNRREPIELLYRLNRVRYIFLKFLVEGVSLLEDEQSPSPQDEKRHSEQFQSALLSILESFYFDPKTHRMYRIKPIELVSGAGHTLEMIRVRIQTVFDNIYQTFEYLNQVIKSFHKAVHMMADMQILYATCISNLTKTGVPSLKKAVELGQFGCAWSSGLEMYASIVRYRGDRRLWNIWKEDIPDLDHPGKMLAYQSKYVCHILRLLMQCMPPDVLTCINNIAEALRREVRLSATLWVLLREETQLIQALSRIRSGNAETPFEILIFMPCPNWVSECTFSLYDVVFPPLPACAALDLSNLDAFIHQNMQMSLFLLSRLEDRKVKGLNSSWVYSLVADAYRCTGYEFPDASNMSEEQLAKALAKSYEVFSSAASRPEGDGPPDSTDSLGETGECSKSSRAKRGISSSGGASSYLDNEEECASPRKKKPDCPAKPASSIEQAGS